MSINYFETNHHTIEVTCKVDGVDMSHVLHATLRRGSAAGFFAEELTAALLKEHLNHAPVSGSDFCSKSSGVRVECKGLNRNGVDLSPSMMKGKGRRFDRDLFQEDARTKDFIIADTSSLENSFSYVVIPGEHVADTIGNKVTYKRKSILFDSKEKTRPVNW